MSYLRVQLSPQYFPNPDRSRAIFGGSVYVGEPDLDPEVAINQKTIYMQEEDGTVSAISQPVTLGAGGVPLYNGSPITLLVEGEYSLKILDYFGSQVYYVPNLAYAQEHGIYEYVSDYGSLAAAESELGGGNDCILIGDLAEILTADVSLSSNILFIPMPNHVIDRDDQNLSFGKPIPDWIEFYWIDDTDATGTLTFAAGTIPKPIWFGPNTTPGTTDMTSQIQSAIESIKASQGIVEFAAEEYAHTGIIGHMGMTLRGQGQDSTKLTNIATDGSHAITGDGANETGSKLDYTLIQDMWIAGNSLSGDGINYDDVQYCKFERIKITGHGGNGYQGIKSATSINDDITFSHCEISDNVGWGIKSGTQTDATDAFNNLTLDDVHLLRNGSDGVAGNAFLCGNQFRMKGGSCTGFIEMDRVYNGYFENVLFEHAENFTNPYLLKATGTTVARDLMIMACTFSMRTATGTSKMIDLTNVQQFNILGGKAEGNSASNVTFLTTAANCSGKVCGTHIGDNDGAGTWTSWNIGDKKSVRITDIYNRAITLWENVVLEPRYYRKNEQFDIEDDGTDIGSWNTSFWTRGGTNSADADVTMEADEPGMAGKLVAAGAQNDSTWIAGPALIRVNNNCRFETEFKLNSTSDIYVAVGFVEGTYDDATEDDDVAVISYDTAAADTNWMLRTNDNNAGIIADDLGIAVSTSYVKFKVDLEDTEQPRVWINDVEIAASSITGTVQSGTSLMPFIMVMTTEAGGAEKNINVKYFDMLQEP